MTEKITVLIRFTPEEWENVKTLVENEYGKRIPSRPDVIRTGLSMLYNRVFEEACKLV